MSGESSRTFSGFEPLVLKEDFDDDESGEDEEEEEDDDDDEEEEEIIVVVHKPGKDSKTSVSSGIKTTTTTAIVKTQVVLSDEEEDEEEDSASSTESINGEEDSDEVEQEQEESRSQENSPSNSVRSVRAKKEEGFVVVPKAGIKAPSISSSSPEMLEPKQKDCVNTKRLSTVVPLHNNKGKERGHEVSTAPNKKTESSIIASSNSNKALQKMPSVDFKHLKSGLSSLLNEPRQSEQDGGESVLLGSTAKGSELSSPSSFKGMPSPSSSKGGEGSLIYKKPGIKPKPTLNAEQLERFNGTAATGAGKDTQEVIRGSTERVNFGVGGGGGGGGTTSTVPGGLPPMPPPPAGTHLLFGQQQQQQSGGLNKGSRGLTTTCSTSGCPAWTCCEGSKATQSQQQQQSRTARSLLSPLRTLTLSSPVSERSNLLEGALRSHGGGGGGNKGGRKKPSNVKRNYAASLPDQDWNNSSTNPFGFDLSPSTCHQFDHHGKKLNLLGTHSSFRGHPGPTKNCKSKHLWARASLEREVVIPQPSASPNNRHSSYHPYSMESGGSLVGGTGGPTSSETAAAAAAAAAAAYSHVLHNSRPSSPICPSVESQCLGNAGRLSCGNDWELGSCCLRCATKTFPRSTNRLSSIGCHCCHHHCDTGSAGTLGGSLLGLDYEDRLLRLESDKDTLHLQVSVLSDQIEAQTSKIQDLEKLLDDKKSALESTEDHLQRELVTRSGLETQKLELMTEISGLRLKHATLERENIELKGRICTGTGRSLTELNYPENTRIWDKPPAAPGVRGTSPAQTASELGQRLRLTSDNSQGLPHHQQRVQTPPANAYRRVDQTTSFGTLPRRNQPAALSTFNSAGGVGVNHPVDASTKCNSLSSGNINAISANFSSNGGNIQNKSSSLQHYLLQDKSRHQHQLKLSLPPQVLQIGGGGGGGGGSSVGDFNSNNSHSLLTPRTQMPTQLKPFIALQGISKVPFPNTSNSVGSRSTSVPNLIAGSDDWARRAGTAPVNNSNTNKSSSGGGGHKSRRILRILGKLKRSNSGGLDNEVVPETRGEPQQPGGGGNNPFVRGGLRATAAPRLGWAKEPTPVRMPDGPVSSWDSEAVVAWLNFLGLGMYANEIKRWVKSGQQLLDATTQELEKELSIKNGLHRKKLSLALHYLKHPDEEDNAGKLDYHWVTRWLDDVGLPQYKEAFAEARVDGRILSHLTAEDLLTLKVTSAMHHASIKRGIQILRIHRFHPSCLCRRGSTAGVGGDSTRDPKHVATWTNHRVMEWLKAVDLAEYAPNLRGSGVHGALVVFEPRFNSELLATLLSIPGNKTLLRRHLSLQFNELIGRYIVQEKRLAELASDFIPINPTVKVKAIKKTQFPLRKKRLSNEFTEELICPSDWNSFPVEWGSENQLNNDSFDSEGSFGGGKVSNI